SNNNQRIKFKKVKLKLHNDCSNTIQVNSTSKYYLRQSSSLEDDVFEKFNNRELGYKYNYYKDEGKVYVPYYKKYLKAILNSKDSYTITNIEDIEIVFAKNITSAKKSNKSIFQCSEIIEIKSPTILSGTFYIDVVNMLDLSDKIYKNGTSYFIPLKVPLDEALLYPKHKKLKSVDTIKYKSINIYIPTNLNITVDISNENFKKHFNDFLKNLKKENLPINLIYSKSERTLYKDKKSLYGINIPKNLIKGKEFDFYFVKKDKSNIHIAFYSDKDKLSKINKEFKDYKLIPIYIRNENISNIEEEFEKIIKRIKIEKNK
ncbi:MAG: hypothetical protein U9N59_03730, partial [Campylobacterota bacterium]|nr:hypothetical protein [Campylobacterota bacterium]